MSGSHKKHIYLLSCHYTRAEVVHYNHFSLLVEERWLFKEKAKAEFLKYSREFFNTTKYVVGGGVDEHVAQPGGDPDW